MTDLRREYVVEALVPTSDSKPGLTGPVNTPSSVWVAVHRTDNQEEAVCVAREEHVKRSKPGAPINTRVRQFWVQYGPTATVAGIAPKGPTVPATELHTVVCPNHPGEQARVYDVAVTVRCPNCKTAMVPEEMAKALGTGDVVDLE